MLRRINSITGYPFASYGQNRETSKNGGKDSSVWTSKGPEKGVSGGKNRRRSELKRTRLDFIETVPLYSTLGLFCQGRGNIGLGGVRKLRMLRQGKKGG